MRAEDQEEDYEMAETHVTNQKKAEIKFLKFKKLRMYFVAGRD